MIPEIGVVVACYVFTRMLHVLIEPFPTGPKAFQVLHLVLKVFAGATMMVAVLVGIDLALRGVVGVSLSELK